MSEVEGIGPHALPGLREQVAKILEEASRQGASACEVSVSMEQGLSTTVRQREVETVEFNRDQGFGITLYVGQRKGSASTTGSGDEAVRETVAAALAIAKHSSAVFILPSLVDIYTPSILCAQHSCQAQSYSMRPTAKP